MGGLPGRDHRLVHVGLAHPRGLSRGAIAMVAAASLAAAAPADSVYVQGSPPYLSVRVMNLIGCELVFRATAGGVIRKPVAEITFLKILGRSDLSEAEQLMKTGEKAIARYDKAFRVAGESWMKRLVRHRLLRALDQAGTIGRAVEQWLAIVDANEASAQALALRPEKLAPKGSGENARAIELLVGKLGGVSEPSYAAAIRQLLLKVYWAEGREKQAVALAKAIGESPAVREPGRERDPRPTPAGTLQAQLEAAAVLIGSGRADQALPQIEANLKSYSHVDLSRALLLAGRAQMQMARKADKDGQRRLLLKAGLNFMRVAFFFPDRDEAPEALYEAGRVNALLGNTAAARTAFQQVLERYPKQKIAQKARAEVAAMSGRR